MLSELDFRDPVETVLDELSRRWEAPYLRDLCKVRFSRRMTRRFGYALPASGRIVIAARVLDTRPEVLDEVLTHEAAHVLAYDRWGDHVRPHGAQWRWLMMEAGQPPRVRMPPLPNDIPNVRGR